MISSVEGSTIITRSYSTQHALLPTKPTKSSPPALPTTPLQEAHIFVSFVGKHTHPIPMLLEIQVFTESNYGMSCSPHYLVCKGKVSMVIL